MNPVALRWAQAMVVVAGIACGPSAAVTGVQLAGPSTIVAGFPLQLTATVTGTGTFDNAVDFTLVSGSGVLRHATATSVSFFGSPGTTGSATVRATSRADPTHSASRTITVASPEPPVLDVSGHWDGTLTSPVEMRLLIADFTAVDGGGYTVQTGGVASDRASCLGPVGALAKGPAVVSGSEVYLDTFAPSGAEVEHFGTLTTNPDGLVARTVNYGKCAGHDGAERFHR
jgi:hypothetical protein